MLPKWHILLGFLFSYILYWFSSITIFQASLIFLASVLIDTDHYIWYVYKKKSWNLKNAFFYLKNKTHKKKILMIFHTIEVHIVLGLLGFVWNGFLYIFMGMVFHSIVDFIDLTHRKELWVREFSFTNYIISDKKNYN